MLTSEALATYFQYHRPFPAWGSFAALNILWLMAKKSMESDFEATKAGAEESMKVWFSSWFFFFSHYHETFDLS
jgi:hypothetical protein